MKGYLADTTRDPFGCYLGGQTLPQAKQNGQRRIHSSIPGPSHRHEAILEQTRTSMVELNRRYEEKRYRNPVEITPHDTALH